MSVKVLGMSCWLAVAAILGAVCFFGGRVEGAESANTGFIPEDTRVCVFNDITPENVETWNTYDALITRLEAVGLNGLTDAERALGAFLSHPERCGTVAMDYRVVLFRVEGEYILLLFDRGYGFVPLKYITTLESFHADEIL